MLAFPVETNSFKLIHLLQYKLWLFHWPRIHYNSNNNDKNNNSLIYVAFRDSWVLWHLVLVLARKSYIQ